MNPATSYSDGSSARVRIVNVDHPRNGYVIKSYQISKFPQIDNPIHPNHSSPVGRKQICRLQQLLLETVQERHIQLFEGLLLGKNGGG